MLQVEKLIKGRNSKAPIPYPLVLAGDMSEAVLGVDIYVCISTHHQQRHFGLTGNPGHQAPEPCVKAVSFNWYTAGRVTSEALRWKARMDRACSYISWLYRVIVPSTWAYEEA